MSSLSIGFACVIDGGGAAAVVWSPVCQLMDAACALVDCVQVEQGERDRLKGCGFLAAVPRHRHPLKP